MHALIVLECSPAQQYFDTNKNIAAAATAATANNSIKVASGNNTHQVLALPSQILASSALSRSYISSEGVQVQVKECCVIFLS